jgi:hypothetical protein
MWNGEKEVTRVPKRVGKGVPGRGIHTSSFSCPFLHFPELHVEKKGGNRQKTKRMAKRAKKGTKEGVKKGRCEQPNFY